MSEYEQTPGELLAYLMRRRGWSAPRLAEMTRGEVSASSVRAYLADGTAPRPSSALAIANALGPKDGRRMLLAWGLDDLADGFLDQWRISMTGDDDTLEHSSDHYYRYNLLEYPGEPLTDGAREAVLSMITWMQAMEHAQSGGHGTAEGGQPASGASPS